MSLRADAPPATVTGVHDPDKLDKIIAALGQLTVVVGTLAEKVAQQADLPASVPAATTIVLSQDPGYEPLVPESDDNLLGRLRLARMLGLDLGSPGAELLLSSGARGFYRKLEREEGQYRLQFAPGVAQALVEDALLECPAEASDMGADLLKVWDVSDPEAPGVTVDGTQH